MCVCRQVSKILRCFTSKDDPSCPFSTRHFAFVVSTARLFAAIYDVSYSSKVSRSSRAGRRGGEGRGEGTALAACSCSRFSHSSRICVKRRSPACCRASRFQSTAPRTKLASPPLMFDFETCALRRHFRGCVARFSLRSAWRRTRRPRSPI